MAARPVRVLLAKIGLDGHDRGVKVIARGLRDAGMEVIYTGLHRRPQDVVQMALDEDVDVVGVSVLSGAHMTIFPRLLELFSEQGDGDVILMGGGTILPEDIEALEAMGVDKMFGIDTPLTEVVEFVRVATSERATRVP